MRTDTARRTAPRTTANQAQNRTPRRRSTPRTGPFRGCSWPHRTARHTARRRRQHTPHSLQCPRRTSCPWCSRCSRTRSMRSSRLARRLPLRHRSRRVRRKRQRARRATERARPRVKPSPMTEARSTAGRAARRGRKAGRQDWRYGPLEAARCARVYWGPARMRSWSLVSTPIPSSPPARRRPARGLHPGRPSIPGRATRVTGAAAAAACERRDLGNGPSRGPPNTQAMDLHGTTCQMMRRP